MTLSTNYSNFLCFAKSTTNRIHSKISDHLQIITSCIFEAMSRVRYDVNMPLQEYISIDLANTLACIFYKIESSIQRSTFYRDVISLFQWTVTEADCIVLKSNDKTI